MAVYRVEREMKKEARGWLYMALIMLAFPILFFACVYFPIFLEVASPY